MRRMTYLVAASLALMPSADLSAQDLGGYHLGMAMGGLITNQTAITQTSIGRTAAANVRRRTGSPQNVDKAQAGASSKSQYQVSTARRKANLARFVQKTRPVDPQGAAAMEQLFATKDIIAEMGILLQPFGLRVDDVADAYTIWWMDAWDAAHGVQGAPDRAKMRAVRAQAAQAIAATPEMARADDAAKQEYAEALLVQAALIEAMVEQYGKDPAMAQRIAASVRQGARGAGLDLDAMTLTADGFVPR
jgi:hypothetical protein